MREASENHILIVEALLLCSPEPLSGHRLHEMFDGELSVRQIESILVELQTRWQSRGLELVRVASGWRFQSRPILHDYLRRLKPERVPNYSRATLETLAIIAWRQPVSRSDIEAIRGVSVSPQIIQTLHERGWIEVIGNRDAPGRPALFGTTKKMLDDLGMRTLDDLPELETDNTITSLEGAIIGTSAVIDSVPATSQTLP